VTGKVGGGVHSLTEWHVGGWLHDLRPKLLRVIEMAIHVFNTHENILVDLIRARRPEAGP
jgi:hypothetical protein